MFQSWGGPKRKINADDATKLEMFSIIYMAIIGMFIIFPLFTYFDSPNTRSFPASDFLKSTCVLLPMLIPGGLGLHFSKKLRKSCMDTSFGAEHERIRLFNWGYASLWGGGGIVGFFLSLFYK